MNEKVRVLLADIAVDQDQISQIFEKLSGYETLPTDPEQAIVAGYYLHNLYTAFEHICVLIASAFENQIADRSQWHSLLLRRMAQPIEGFRPRLFREETFRCLDELRAFRHVFRGAYSVTLDPDRVALVLHKAKELRSLYLHDLEQFQEFLKNI